MSAGSQKKVSSHEITSFSLALNEMFKDDVQLRDLIPIDAEDPNCLFDSFANGLALCKLCLKINPECGIQLKALNTGKNLNIYKIRENLAMGLKAAGSLGIKMLGVGTDNFIKKDAHLVLTVLW